jgi:glycerophosphoryl diester phosphodiesterase
MSARGKRRWLIALVVVCALAFVIWFGNTSRRVEPSGQAELLAHRGLAQTFDLAGVQNDTCTAERIHPPEHPYLENTIESMRAAFDAGADIVEFDVHLTKDDRFAVFHDWELDCRTNGRGVTGDYTMDELRKLDIGYGYTADGGKTYPFRGKGIGLMPSLDEVLGTFPDRQLLIDVKSNDPAEGELLADALEGLPERRLARLAVYGGDEPIAALQQRLPNLRVMSKATLKACLLRYEAAGWTGWVPQECQNTELHVPEGIGKWLWGWPHRFVDRMEKHGTRVVIVGGSGEFSAGFDSTGDLARLPEDYSGVVWTNRIDRVSASLRQSASTADANK